MYMDYNATTPLDPEVKALMVEHMDTYANASSLHELGRSARAEIEEARAQIGMLIGEDSASDSVIFTSGGSESNNTVFATMFHLRRKSKRNKIITTSIEHPCVLNAAKWLAEEGFPVRFLKVDSSGKIDMDELQSLLDEETLLVSVMMANNEIGTIQDITRITAMAKAKGAFVHTDATQAVGKIRVDVRELGVDYLTLSCHKLYGPKGIGALYVRKGSPLEPLIRGGHQEHGHRAGTYNNLGILGFGKAAELAGKRLGEYGERMTKLRKRLRDGLAERIPMIHINGHENDVLPNTLNVSFPGAEGESILLYLDLAGIEVSTGSACASGSLDPSHVLLATGLGPELAHGSIRFSLGMQNTEADVDYVLEEMPKIIKRLRGMSTVSTADIQSTLKQGASK